MSRDKYFLQEDEGSSNPSQVGPSAWRRRYNHVVDVIAAAALIGLFFYVTRDAGQPDLVRIGKPVVAQGTQPPSQNYKIALAASRQTEANQASAPEEAQRAEQVAVAAGPKAQQSLTEERAQALAQELTEARRAIERLDVQLRAEAAKTAQSLEQERERTAVLAQEAAAARQELTASTAQHRQALDEERARRAALASELAAAQREIETQLAVLRKAGDEAVPLKQAADSAMADVPLFGKSATRPMHWHGTLNPSGALRFSPRRIAKSPR
jgi:flagellar biosynthesis GTPase FlhF